MNCVIIDDDPLACRLLEEFIKKTEFLQLRGVFGGPLAASHELAAIRPDLIFLDVEMPDMTGIEFLQTLQHKMQVIFVSSKENYAIDAFNLNAVDYLLKPPSFARFFKAAQKALDAYQQRQDSGRRTDSIFVKSGGTLVKIVFDEVLWIEALENYCIIHTIREKITAHYSLKLLQTLLPENQFLRIHRSSVVNIQKVKVVDINSVIVAHDQHEHTVVLSRKERDRLLSLINCETNTLPQ